MPRNQFFRRELLPGVDIDAVAIRDAKQALRLTHDRADALISRVDQLDAGSESPVGAGDALHIMAMLSLEQPFPECFVAREGLTIRIRVRRASWRDPDGWLGQGQYEEMRW